VAVALGAGVALASQPKPWQMNFQPAATPVMDRLVDFNILISVIIVAINIFVVVLLGYVIWRFNAKRNPTPSKTSHNTLLEVIWTAAPILILLVIAIPSFKLLYYADRAVDAEMTIKAVGHQWYWSYEYPDHGAFSFDATLVCRTDEECAEAAEDGVTPIRLLDTDMRVVLPVDTTIRLLVTADDVIHNWAMPSFGIKLDAVPGRVNETWMKIQREGVYYGQCSELCGVDHGFMPITVEAVSKAAFAAWVARAKQEFARNDAPATTMLARTSSNETR
jgi:cytochrome c oxidase subunit 2